MARVLVEVRSWRKTLWRVYDCWEGEKVTGLKVRGVRINITQDCVLETEGTEKHAPLTMEGMSNSTFDAKSKTFFLVTNGSHLTPCFGWLEMMFRAAQFLQSGSHSPPLLQHSPTSQPTTSSADPSSQAPSQHSFP